MKVAVIDIGTNTVLLLVAECVPPATLSPLAYEQRVPRLGAGIDAAKRLDPESMKRVLAVLEEYRTIIRYHAADRITVIGTSAVRDAANRDEFARLIAAHTGFSLEVLSGRDEARWTFRGALSGNPECQSATVLDIGGGSTEFTTGDTATIWTSQSINIGSVRLTERLLHSDPPLPEELASLQSTIHRALDSVKIPNPPPAPLIAVAGTATTLALLAQEKADFSLPAVSGYCMSRSAVRSLTNYLTRLSTQEILTLGKYMAGRSDVITAGAIILDEVMERWGWTDVRVSERGVRYGIALREMGGGEEGERVRRGLL